MGLWDDITSKVEGAADSVSDWWQSTEDKESAPQSYQQQGTAERLAEGSALPQVASAQNNTGETVRLTASSLASYQPYLIGGGVLVVVLLFALMLRGK